MAFDVRFLEEVERVLADDDSLERAVDEYPNWVEMTMHWSVPQEDAHVSHTDFALFIAYRYWRAAYERRERELIAVLEHVSAALAYLKEVHNFAQDQLLIHKRENGILEQAHLFDEATPEESDPEGRTYFTLTMSGKGLAVKIGKAIDPRKRGKQLKTGDPDPHWRLGSIPGGCKKESSIHRQVIRFGGCRVRSDSKDWFIANDSTMQIIRHLLEQPGAVIEDRGRLYETQT